MAKATWIMGWDLFWIHVLNGLGYNDQNIAELIDRGRMTIVRHRTKLNLPSRSIVTLMSAIKKSNSQRKTYQKNFGHSGGNYAQIHRRVKAAKLGFPGFGLTEAKILNSLLDGKKSTKEIAQMTKLSNTRILKNLVGLRRGGYVVSVRKSEKGVRHEKEHHLKTWITPLNPSNTFLIRDDNE